jgi:hypothetical protein
MVYFYIDGGNKMAQKVIHYPEYWGGKKLAHPFVPPEQGKFSRSVVVGNLIEIEVVGVISRE